MYENIIVGNKIQKVCEEKGISMRQLAHKAGISETQIYKANSQDANFRLDTIARIMIALDCKFDDIFTIRYW